MVTESLTFVIRRGDTKPALRTRCLNGDPEDVVNLDDIAVDLTLATTVRVLVKNSSGTLILNGVMTKENQAVAATKGYVNRPWVLGETATAGTFPMEFQVEWADGGIQTFPADRYAELVVLGDLGP